VLFVLCILSLRYWEFVIISEMERFVFEKSYCVLRVTLSGIVEVYRSAGAVVASAKARTYNGESDSEVVPRCPQWSPRWSGEAPETNKCEFLSEN